MILMYPKVYCYYMGDCFMKKIKNKNKTNMVKS